MGGAGDKALPLPVAPLAAGDPVEAHLRHDFSAPSPPLEAGAGGGRWCPFCGANLTHVPVRDERDEAVFAVAGRRLKVAIAVGFVVVWVALSVYDFVSEPGAIVLPGWFSALGALMLIYLLGVNPWGLMRRR
jgi:hypothetical protein